MSMARDEDKTVPFDRRQSRRFAARINVNFRSLDELVTTYTSDLSRGGIFVAASVQLPPGTEVQLSIDVPDGGPPARIPARVAYVLDRKTAQKQGRVPGMGMQFHGSDVASLGERIAAHLAQSVESQPIRTT